MQWQDSVSPEAMRDELKRVFWDLCPLLEDATEELQAQIRDGTDTAKRQAIGLLLQAFQVLAKHTLPDQFEDLSQRPRSELEQRALLLLGRAKDRAVEGTAPAELVETEDAA